MKDGVTQKILEDWYAEVNDFSIPAGIIQTPKSHIRWREQYYFGIYDVLSSILTDAEKEKAEKRYLMKKSMMISAGWRKRREQGKRERLRKRQLEGVRGQSKRQIIDAQAKRCHDFIQHQTRE